MAHACTLRREIVLPPAVRQQLCSKASGHTLFFLGRHKRREHLSRNLEMCLQSRFRAVLQQKTGGGCVRGKSVTVWVQSLCLMTLWDSTASLTDAQVKFSQCQKINFLPNCTSFPMDDIFFFFKKKKCHSWDSCLIFELTRVKILFFL